MAHRLVAEVPMGFSRAEQSDSNIDFPILLLHLEKSVQSNCENRRAKGLVVGIPFQNRLGPSLPRRLGIP
jgi:hypothetical protein